MRSNKIIAGLFFVFGIISFLLFQAKSGSIILALIIILYVFLIFKYQKNRPLVLFFIYALIFNLYLIPKFWFNIDIVYYSKFDNIILYTKALFINFLFILSFVLFLKPQPENYFFPQFKYLFKPNKVIVIINLIIMTSIFLWGFSGKNILDNVTYGSDYFGSKTIYTEYYLLFLILAIIHSKPGLWRKVILLLSILMIIKSILFGSRITALLIILTLYILLSPNKFSLKKILIFASLGLIGMNLIGMIRLGYFTTDLGTLLRIQNKPIISSSQSNMFYGSVAFVGLIEHNVWDFTLRLKSLIGFIFRIFVPSSWSFEAGALANFIQKYTPTGGGAHPATYFYVWFSWLGPILFGYFLAAVLNKLHHKKITSIFYLFVIVLLVTFPRWFGYEPGIIFKMGWIIIFIYFLLKMFTKKTTVVR